MRTTWEDHRCLHYPHNVCHFSIMYLHPVLPVIRRLDYVVIAKVSFLDRQAFDESAVPSKPLFPAQTALGLK